TRRWPALRPPPALTCHGSEFNPDPGPARAAAAPCANRQAMSASFGIVGCDENLAACLLPKPRSQLAVTIATICCAPDVTVPHHVAPVKRSRTEPPDSPGNRRAVPRLLRLRGRIIGGMSLHGSGFCILCGAHLETGHRFCWSCGAPRWAPEG